MVLQVKELTFTYPDAAFFSEKHFTDMNQGQILGIVGAVQANRKN